MRTVQNLTGSPGRVPPTQHLRGRVAGDARWRAMPGANFVANDLSYCPPLWPDSAARTATATVDAVMVTAAAIDTMRTSAFPCRTTKGGSTGDLT